MKKIIITFLFFGFFSADFALAANGADCVKMGGMCSTSCVSGGQLGLYDCPNSNPMCCGNPSEAQKKLFSPGGTNAFSAPALNTKTTTFGNPLGENMGTVDRVIVSLQGYLNNVAATIALVFILIGAALYAIAALGKPTLAELGKKIVIVAVGGFAVVVAAPVIWKEIKLIVGGQPEAVATTSGAVKILSAIPPFFAKLIGLYAILGFLIGAITMLVAGGNEKTYERGKTILKWVLMGTVIAFGAVVIARQIIALFAA